MFGSKRRIFAGKQKLHEEPFCPVTTNDTGYLELFRGRTGSSSGSSALSNTGSFGPVPERRENRPYIHQRWW